ncbi:MAG TPA: hypothetical protein PLK02_08050 [Paludibacteraceae bacterium]|nr:hypothetical protein [Paludibacteraceae bacterium]
MNKVSKKIVDYDHCLVCGKPVVFVRGVKPNGYVGIIAYHEEDVLEGSEIVETTNSYKRWTMRKLHPKTEEIITDDVSEVTSEVPEIIVPEKPEVDITGLKHNIFVITGKVMQTLRSAGQEETAKLVRANVLTNGKNMSAVLKIVNEFVVITENGNILI